ncbi:MAG: glycosyltransferase [Acidobacteriota bacterium]|nr:glycosyltransferase [Acidobacteriota bacterium]
MAHSTNIESSETREIENSVSVVVPSYNHARFVERTLRSIFAQTHAPAELVVIDDGSRDESVRVVERALASCPFPCELIARENRGLSAALNEGLARASRGRYFAYLGSDDLWLPDFLRERAALLGERTSAVVAYGHCFYIDADDRVTDCTADWARYADGDAREMLWSGVAPHSPTVVYRRDALARHGWNEGARLEDYELYLRLAAEGEFAFDPRVLSAWRVHGGNASRELGFMMGEWFAAQRRAARDLGLGADELARARDALGWSCAENFARRGARAKACAVAWRHRRGAPSLASAGALLARLAVPRAVWRTRRLRREDEATRRYGKINV